jgi:hypothetical protein
MNQKTADLCIEQMKSVFLPGAPASRRLFSGIHESWSKTLQRSRRDAGAPGKRSEGRREGK